MLGFFRFVCIASVFGLASGNALADFTATVTPTITSQGGGVFLYSYLVTDTASSTSPIAEFDLSLTILPTSGVITPTGATIASITAPTGFLKLYTSGDPSISFVSSDPSTDIQPGSSVTFSFTSTFAAVLVPYQLQTFDGSGKVITGSILAPATVPEPSSLLLIGLGTLGLMGRHALSKRRKPNM